MEFIINSEISFPKSSQNTDFRYKITVIPLYQNDGYSLKTNPNTNAPPFEVRGCKQLRSIKIFAEKLLCFGDTYNLKHIFTAIASKNNVSTASITVSVAAHSN